MNVQVENLPNCIITLRIEVPPAKVAETQNAITGEYTRQAKIPGYRPGKAPQQIIQRKFQKQIREELEQRLLNESTRNAISENKINALNIEQVDDVEFGDDQTLRFTATVVTAPEFEMPEYKGIVVHPKSAELSDEEIEQTLNSFRERFADFEDIADRGLEMEDFAVIDYAGTIDGKPVSEVAPKAGAPLSSKEDFWIKLTPESFFPGFSEQLVGAKADETREFDLDVPADFPVSELAGKKIHYKVTVKGLKTQVLPELTDELAAKIIPNKTVAELRDIIKEELTKQKVSESEGDKREQIMTHLLASVECELPQSLLRQETERLLDNLVRENQSRGVTDEILEQNKKDLVAAATQGARERVKGTFILVRIAEAEKIKVEREDMMQRITQMAIRNQMPVEKLIKELEKRKALSSIQEEVLTTKALDFLAANASVQASS